MHKEPPLDIQHIISSPLNALSELEWEALCDHCGRCCLVKLEDDETNDVYYTNMICHQYDLQQGKCSDYSQRKEKVPGCVDIKKFGEQIYSQLPETCAYRLRHNGLPLYEWHPLIAGSHESMLEVMPHIKFRAILETDIHEEQFEDHIVDDIK